MAERSEKAQQRVREELQKNPGASTTELQDAAKSVEPSVAELSLRQFNAGYVLPLKRSKSARGRKSKGEASAPAKTRQRQGGRRKAAQTPTETPKRGGGRQAAPARAPEGERERVRAALLEFARDFSDAESRSEIVAVLSDVDRYVDRIVESRA